MALTRENVETILLRRLGKLLIAAGLDGTGAGSNPDLADPVGYAIRQLGLVVDYPPLVTDTDTARVGVDDYDEFLDRAELRALETIQGNLDLVDISTGPHSESLHQLADQLEKMIERKRGHVLALYGYGVGSIAGGIETGVISLGFMQQGAAA